MKFRQLILFLFFLGIICGLGNECSNPPGGPGDRFTVELPRSRDPNEMSGPAGFGGDNRYVLPGERLEYTVFFENQSTATAAAQEITIDADLSTYLDWSTFEFGDIDLGGQSMTDLRGRQQGEAIVSLKGRSDFVKAVVTVADGHLKLYMRSWDKARSKNGYWPEDDYDGILQPNDDTGRGEGHFTYRISVKDQDDLVALKAEAPRVITAAADIVFDENEVITTDPSWHNTIYSEAPMAVTKTAIPAETRLPLETTSLNWTDGGGATSYDVTFWQVDGNGKVLGTWTVKNLPMTSCTLPMTLVSGAFYRWQITSRNDFGFTKSAEMSFQVEYNGDVIAVNPGWNLLAVTRKLDKDGEAMLLQETSYVLNASTKALERAKTFALGTPFWHFAPSYNEIIFIGEEPELWSPLQPEGTGWFLLGIATDNAIPSWVESAWEWDRGKFVKLSSSELLLKGHAYWIFVAPRKE